MAMRVPTLYKVPKKALGVTSNMRKTEARTCENESCEYTGEEAVLVTTPLLLQNTDERKRKGGAERRRRRRRRRGKRRRRRRRSKGGSGEAVVGEECVGVTVRKASVW